MTKIQMIKTSLSSFFGFGYLVIWLFGFACLRRQACLRKQGVKFQAPNSQFHLFRHSEFTRPALEGAKGPGGSESSAGCLINIDGSPPPEDPELSPTNRRGKSGWRIIY